jgi:GTP-binding protein HflX
MQLMSRDKGERACLIALARSSLHKAESAASLDELEELTLSAGAAVQKKILQTRIPDPAYFIGRGMVDKIKEDINSDGTNLVIFDDPLSPAQQRNLEEAFRVKVIDRSILILDIFALHARTAAAKMQVELAQLEYTLPRLAGAWSHFSRQYGGIGTKGPGETQLETDRRRIRKKIAHLKDEIERLSQQRQTQRKSRQKLFKVALIGYTNAGKSTLFNALTKSDAKVEDRLFTTLDSTTRVMSTGYPEKIIFTDTVGFIKKLPHQLVASFMSTLEEAAYSNLLLKIIDISDSNYKDKIIQTTQVLEEIGATHIDSMTIYNKIDRGTEEHPAHDENSRAFYISALTGEGLDGLRDELSHRLSLFSTQIPKD